MDDMESDHQWHWEVKEVLKHPDVDERVLWNSIYTLQIELARVKKALDANTSMLNRVF